MSSHDAFPLSLALELSGLRCGCAVLRGGRVLSKVEPEEQRDRGRALMPAVREALAAAGVAPRDLTFLSVDTGPGSYTGVRLGVMAAKSLAFGLNLPIAPVSSLAALAVDAACAAQRTGALEPMDGTDRVSPAPAIVPFQDARRDEVYAARYRLAPSPSADALGLEADAAPEALLVPVAEVADMALTPEEALRLATGAGCAVVGSAVGRYPELIAPLAEAGTAVLAEPAAPRPETVGRLGWLAYRRGACVDAITLQPTYLRRDDAPAVFERREGGA